MASKTYTSTETIKTQSNIEITGFVIKVAVRDTNPDHSPDGIITMDYDAWQTVDDMNNNEPSFKLKNKTDELLIEGIDRYETDAPQKALLLSLDFGDGIASILKDVLQLTSEPTF